jgi:alanine dehydrogenase
MTTGSLPPLRFLNAAEVIAALPPLAERLLLAERTLVGLATGAELPPKIGVNPRPEASFGHAMPAHLRGDAADGSADLVGMKWITGVPGNRAIGLPALHALVIVNDPQTGVPFAILDGGPITAARTAAISGVAISRWAPATNGRPPRAAVIGAGAQGHSHVPMLGHVLPGVEVTIHDRDQAFAAVLASMAEETEGIATARVAANARDAVAGADVVVTCVSFGPVRQVMKNDWFAPGALIVAVDYAMSVAAEVARDAGLFLTDERAQFEANRAAGEFDGYPDPTAILGEALLAGTPRPPAGRVLVSHLGVGLADLVFADAILARAASRGIGTLLSR